MDTIVIKIFKWIYTKIYKKSTIPISVSYETKKNKGNVTYTININNKVNKYIFCSTPPENR